MHPPTVFYAFSFLQAAMATIVAEPIGPEPEVKRAVEPRMPSMGDFPFPKLPARNPHWKGGKTTHKNKNHNGKDKDCPSSGSVDQTNACSSGAPYCCSSDGSGGHLCQNTTACEQTVICCNNNNGFQICIGDLDFNSPITINIYYD